MSVFLLSLVYVLLIYVQQSKYFDRGGNEKFNLTNRKDLTNLQNVIFELL